MAGSAPTFEFIYNCTGCYVSYADKDEYFAHLVKDHGMIIVDGTPTEVQGLEPGQMVEIPDETPAPKVAKRGQPLWTRTETLALIDQYKERLSKFKDPRVRNNTLWQEIAQVLAFGYTAQQCEGRWKTIYSGNKRANDHNNQSGNNKVKYEYEDEIREAVGDKKNINPTHVLDSQNSKSFGIGHSSKRPSFTREQLLNEPGGDDDLENLDESSGRAVKKRRIPKKEDLLSWLKDNEAAQQAQQERHHKENIEVMKELLGVLRGKSGDQN